MCVSVKMTLKTVLSNLQLLLLVRNKSCETSRKENLLCLVAFRGALIVKRRRMADGGNPTHQQSQRSQSDDFWKQGEQQLVRVVQVCTAVRRENAGVRSLGGGDK